VEAIDLTRSLKKDHLNLGLTALNGLVGEKLHNSNSPLAVRMGFYHQNRPMALTRGQFESIDHQLSDKLVILVHGLASNEQMWAFPTVDEDPADTSYGSLLMAEQGFTPLYLRYNSGLHVSHNGRLMAALLEELLEIYPVAAENLVLIGHSMGGLVIRSACHYGEESDARWPSLLSKAVYLGTPHHGVPWEALTAGFFRRIAESENPFLRRLHSLYENRSASMRDIVDMALIDEHWCDDTPQPALPWFEGAEHYFIAGSVHDDPNHILSHAFGDVLVPIGSAGARSALHTHLPAPPEIDRRSAIVPGVKHIALAHHGEVYAHLKEWLSTVAARSEGDGRGELQLAELCDSQGR
jgi:triacylglycerol lipase